MFTGFYGDFALMTYLLKVDMKLYLDLETRIVKHLDLLHLKIKNCVFSN